MNSLTVAERLHERPSQVLEDNRDLIRQICLEQGVENPRVFGSVARGEDTLNSDLDILVRYIPLPGNSKKFWMLQPRLEKALGVRVDVVSEGGLKPRHAGILLDSVPV